MATNIFALFVEICPERYNTLIYNWNSGDTIFNF